MMNAEAYYRAMYYGSAESWNLRDTHMLVRRDHGGDPPSHAPRSGGDIRIGTSGWAYPAWRGRFYPDEVKSKDRLAWYARRFDTVEINASFYRLPSLAAPAAWAAQAPEGFVFAWKPSRFITHSKKLKDAAEPVELAYSRMAPLGAKLGPANFSAAAAAPAQCLAPRGIPAAAGRSRTLRGRVPRPVLVLA